jgi:RNA polymerase sigma factor (sigma-70 family)
MSNLSQAERYLLEQIRAGRQEAWSQLVERYQGRLLAFAQGKLPQRADAEDVVQETFVAFLRGQEKFRGEGSLETYLFSILRRNIVNSFRSMQAQRVCLLQDVCRSVSDDCATADPFQRFAGAGPTGSWYARRDEHQEQRRQALTAALRELIAGFKNTLNFRDLRIVELIFYCQLANRDIAILAGVKENNVAVVKHRCLKQVHQRVGEPAPGLEDEPQLESLLTEVWETQRLSCPKRSTIGAFLLGTLEPAWHEYVDFHLNRLGCHFCRANIEDLQWTTAAADSDSSFRRRIMESTVGFLSKL